MICNMRSSKNLGELLGDKTEKVLCEDENKVTERIVKAS